MTATESPDSRDLISLLRTGEAPPEIRQFAARNLLPLEPLDQTRALVAVLGDSEVGEIARETLRKTPPDSLAHFIQEALPSAIELDEIAGTCDDPLVLEQLIRHPEVSDGTLARLARTVTGGPQEALVINQMRLLRNPDLIDAFFENPELSTDTRRRLLEIREEFFEKGKRKRAAEEAKDEDDERLAAEIAAAEVEEVKVQALRAAGRDPGIVDLETSLTIGAAYRRIAVMTVSEKIKLAYSGGKEERRILMADANKLVGAAVLKGRGLTVNEVESFCGMRHLDEDLFRKIAQNREWMRKPAIIAALVKNPKVNLAVTLPLIKRLHERDLKAVMRDPNLPEGVRISSRKILQERRK